MILLLLMNILSSFAQEGYPKPGAEIESIFKNKYCFPIVVNLNDKTLSLDEGAAYSIPGKKWGEWNWLPGKMSNLKSKTVYYPLKDHTIVAWGPNSRTHPNQNAYDFDVPVGTPVRAIDDGVVIRIISHFSKAHSNPDLDEGNQIEILHADGTVSDYHHLKKDSAKVSLCQKVKALDVIGETGNTGYSEGPHLHLEVYRPLDGKKLETLPLVFRP